MSTAILTRDTARAGLSLAAVGGLPPRRDLAAAVATEVVTKPIDRGSMFTQDLFPGLAKVLRPQSAFQWWSLPYLSSITPQYVQNILVSGAAGNHVACWQIFDLMIDTNPEIAACIGEFVDAICGKKLIIEPYHEEDEPPSTNAIRNQKIVAAALRNMQPEADTDENALVQVIRDIVFARFHGQSVQEVDYYESESDQMHTLDVAGIGTIAAPRCTFWCHPVTYAFDVTGRLGLRMPVMDARELSKNAAARKPGYLPTDMGVGGGMIFSGNGAARPDSVIRFPKNQFLISIIKAKTGNAMSGSCLRPLANWWVYENFAADYAMDLAQIFGIPFRVAHYAPTTTDNDKQFVADMLQNMGSRGWALLPDGIKLEFEKAMATGADSPQGFLIKLCHEQYRKVILRQTMTGSGHGGAAQGSKAGMDTETDVKSICMQAAANYAADQIRQQLARSILKINVGSDAELPFIRLAEESEGDVNDMSRDSTAATLIDIGETYFRKKYGYPKPSPGEAIAKAPTPPPAFGGPGGPGGPAAPGKGPTDEVADPKEEEDPKDKEDLDAAVLTAGDVPGHEFRGNQWTSGGEGHTVNVKDGEDVGAAETRSKSRNSSDTNDRTVPSLVTVRDPAGKATSLTVEHDGKDWLVKNSEGKAVPGKKFHSRDDAKEWTEHAVTKELARRYEKSIKDGTYKHSGNISPADEAGDNYKRRYGVQASAPDTSHSAPETVSKLTMQQLAEALSADLEPLRHAIHSIEQIEDPQLFESKLRELIAEHGPLVKLLADINAYPKAAQVINDATTKHLAAALTGKPKGIKEP